ncbi:hypothetical protein EDB89DRAFT_604393 [Lactarius sanguifluus]|nr:hypothetical protein EDB89DRAFT_604393 [Lactarius sanguifluus]
MTVAVVATVVVITSSPVFKAIVIIVVVMVVVNCGGHGWPWLSWMLTGGPWLWSCLSFSCLSSWACGRSHTRTKSSKAHDAVMTGVSGSTGGRVCGYRG